MNHDDFIPDDFEQRLRRSPPAPLPAAWRAEILSAARAAAMQREPESCTKRLWSAAWWPSPWAWAGVASLWLVILGLNFATRAAEPKESVTAMRISPEMIRFAFAQREQEWAEFFPPSETEPPSAAATPTVIAPGRPRRSGGQRLTPVTV